MAQKKTFYITRQIEFSAAHRLYQESLSEEENTSLYGPCANPYGHGHNYLLECTFRGALNERTQMVIHFSQLKRLLYEVVEAPLDHRHLNHDVAFMRGILPTSENLIAVLWERIQAALPPHAPKLHKLRLASSPRNWVEYLGPEEEPHATPK